MQFSITVTYGVYADFHAFDTRPCAGLAPQATTWTLPASEESAIFDRLACCKSLLAAGILKTFRIPFE